MKSSVYDDGQFELDAPGRSKPVETGESICNMDVEMYIRAYRTSSALSLFLVGR